MPDEGIAFGLCGELVCTTQQSLELLAVWVDAVAAWRDAVVSCPQVKVVTPVVVGIAAWPAEKPRRFDETVRDVVDSRDALYWPDALECARLHVRE